MGLPREHLKRKHYPVQCGRCFQTFTGPDRAALLVALQDHSRHDTPCNLRDPSLKEGISDDQWVLLDKKKSIRKDQELSSVEKWYEIWAVLFPELSKPETPCEQTRSPFIDRELTNIGYDNISTEPVSRSLSEVSQRFCDVFKFMLDRQVEIEDIRFVEGSKEEMKGRVEVIAQQAFEITTGLYELSSTTTSSSTRSRALPSLLEGSYENISIAAPGTSLITSSASHSTPTRSQTYAMNVSSSPTAASLMENSGTGHPARSAPEMFNPFITISPMAQQGSSPNPGRARIPIEHSVHGSYPHRLVDNNVNHFVPSSFNGHNLGSDSDQLYGFNYYTAFENANPVSSLNRADLANPSGGVDPTHTLISPPEDSSHMDGMGHWNQFSSSRQGYDGNQ
jgi:hypothetical protein